MGAPRQPSLAHTALVGEAETRGEQRININTHFTDEDWERIQRDWNTWWAGELERPLVMVDGADAGGQLAFAQDEVKKRLKLARYTLWDLIREPLPAIFPLETLAEEVNEAYTRLLSTMRFFGDSWPRWWPNFGPGIAAAFLGARLNATADTVWFDRPEPVELPSFQPAYDPDNPWWQRVVELTRLAVECWGNQVTIGHTDLGGNLDILASLRTTQNLLLDVHDEPEEVARLAGEVTRLWLRYYDELYAITQKNGRGTTPWAHIWSPGRCYMYQSDFSYMISPEMYERFVMPDLEAVCAANDHNFYHLDGKGQICHLDLLLSLKRLNGIQWIPGDGAPPPEEWLPLLKRIRDGGKLCQLYVSPEGALRIVRTLGGKGFALYILTPMPPREAQDFVKKIMAENSRCR
jgi:5-methyltetrahydrofolate--homocysteine methyltransferase